MIVELNFELWPSDEEIEDCGSTPYLGKLNGYYDSLKVLRDEFRSADLHVRPVNDETTVDGGFGERRAFPPEVVEWVSFIVETGAAVGVYKLLKLWLELKNGRKLRVTLPGLGLEVDATGLSQRQFLKLLTEVESHKKRFSEERPAKSDAAERRERRSRLRESFADSLAAEPVRIRDTDCDERSQEIRRIFDLALRDRTDADDS